MGAEQEYPNNEPKTMERIVYMHVEARLHLTELDEEEAAEHYPDKYRAVAVDYPDVIGFGITQEGALIDAEMKLRKHIKEVAKDQGGSSG